MEEIIPPEDEAPGYRNRTDPFSDEHGSNVKYKSMSWFQCALCMIGETICLGILSLPSALAVVGFVP